jgi:Xaa-Pro aminopeptidase
VTLFTDGRYTEQAKAEVKNARVVISKLPAVVEACNSARKLKPKAVFFEAANISYSAVNQIRHQLRAAGIQTKPLAGVLEQLRVVKDSDEINGLRSAVELGSSLFDGLAGSIKPGVPEAQVAGELELAARKAGAEKMSFDTIVAAGARSALPHGRASSQPVPGNGFIILDYGVILAGYCSDMTRTLHVGPVSEKHRRMYEAVKQAQLASIAAVRPGAEAEEVDLAGRQVLRQAGFDAYFTHSTGHGVGIEIHEQPRIARGQKQKLAPGMVITIEPGIYIPEEGGVRIEDMVLVTATGHEVLTPTTKDLITV